MGEICEILDTKGDITITYKYDAYGYIKEITGKTAYIDTIGKLQPLKYKGYINDEETGYYYLQSRYYSPFLKRFISLDDTGILEETQGEILGANLYAYCNNNPTMMIDETGYEAIVMGAAAGLLLRVALAVLVTMLVAVILSNPAVRRGIVDLVNDFGYRITQAYKAMVSAVATAAAKAMRKSRRAKYERHHIVARSARKAAGSRDILGANRIGINSSYNTVYIKYNLHRHLHTNAYHNSVYGLLKFANKWGYRRGNVIAVLSYIKLVLKTASAVTT